MPVFEYACRACGYRYEKLTRSIVAPDPGAGTCPTCGSDNVERLMSLFGVSGGDPSGGFPPMDAGGHAGHTHGGAT